MKIEILIVLLVSVLAGCHRHGHSSRLLLSHFHTVRHAVPESLETSEEEGSLETETGSCPSAKFARCLAKYASNLGMKKITGRALEFYGKIGEIIQKRGVNGFKDICKASKRFGSCLGSDKESCLSRRHLRQLHLSRRNVLLYRVVSQQLSVECVNPAYKTLVAQWNCVNRTAHQSANITAKCAARFRRDVRKAPRHFCQLYQRLVDCDLAPIQKKCGKDVSAVLCKVSAQVPMKIFVPQCHVSCRPKVLAHRPVFREIHHHQSTPEPVSHESLQEVEAEDDSCSRETWKKCTKEFAKQMGIPNIPEDPQVFIWEYQALLEKTGKAGFVKSCSAINNFTKCLGTEERDCMSFAHLSGVGLNPKEAGGWMVQYHIFKEQCTSEYKVMVDNFECIGTTWSTCNNTLQHCIRDFERYMKYDPPRYCHHTQQLMLCLSKPFKDHCSASVGKAECREYKSGFSSVFPQCSFTCDQQETFNRPHRSADPEDSHYYEPEPEEGG